MGGAASDVPMKSLSWACCSNWIVCGPLWHMAAFCVDPSDAWPHCLWTPRDTQPHSVLTLVTQGHILYGLLWHMARFSAVSSQFVRTRHKLLKQLYLHWWSQKDEIQNSQVHEHGIVYKPAATYILGFIQLLLINCLLLQTTSQYTSVLSVPELHCNHLTEIILDPQEILAYVSLITWILTV
jgi:hypothetical protein